MIVILYPTHLAAGLVASSIVLQMNQVSPQEWPGVLLLSGIACAIPDIDHHNSMASKLYPNSSNIICRFFGKRTATHSLLFAILLFQGLQYLNFGLSEAAKTAIVASFVSHIILDMLNPEGVQIFWPIGPKISLSKWLPWPLTFKTGSWVESFILRPAIWGLAAWALLGDRLGFNI